MDERNFRRRWRLVVGEEVKHNGRRGIRRSTVAMPFNAARWRCIDAEPFPQTKLYSHTNITTTSTTITTSASKAMFLAPDSLGSCVGCTRKPLGVQLWFSLAPHFRFTKTTSFDPSPSSPERMTHVLIGTDKPSGGTTYGADERIKYFRSITTKQVLLNKHNGGIAG